MQTITHATQVTRVLRSRLTVLFASVTALVLTAALCVTYTMACTQARASEQVLLSTTLTAMEDKLRYQSVISDEWLTQQEAAAHSVIYIEDNGRPLQFFGVWQTRTPRDQIIAQARALSAVATVAANVRGARAEATLALSQGESYLVRAVCLARAAQPEAYVTLFVLQDSAVMRGYERQLLLRYALLWLCGVLALFGISRVLVYRALRPAATAWQQQAEFVAAAGHELRSPLAVIRASLAAAQPDTLPPQARSFVCAAEREAQRMTRLTDDLLLLAAGDAGAWRVHRVALSSDTLCIELYERFVALARAEGRALTLQLPDAPLPNVWADAQYFPQLLSVLLQNALDHTPKGTPLEISAVYLPRTVQGGAAATHEKAQKLSKEAVLFAITDHGAGISDADKKTLFQRFSRLDKSRTDKAHFGLGLSVAQEIAALHGSRLHVQDTPGGGTRFCVAVTLYRALSP